MRFILFITQASSSYLSNVNLVLHVMQFPGNPRSIEPGKLHLCYISKSSCWHDLFVYNIFIVLFLAKYRCLLKSF